MARRSKRRGTHENHERWLITYADLITLLLIFFVVMYAMSKVDLKKYEQLSKSLHHQFNKAESPLDRNDGFMGDYKPGKDGSVDPDEPEATPPLTAEQRERLEREEELQNLLATVNQYIADNGLEAQVAATDTRRGVVVKLNDLILFDLGKAELKPASLPILDKLASLFQSLNTKVSIEGHTDNLPLQTGSLYRDNWGLSQARSVSVVRHFLNKEGLRADMFVSSAYADTVPVAPNDTEENRARNRRVEIIVLREPVESTSTTETAAP